MQPVTAPQLGWQQLLLAVTAPENCPPGKSLALAVPIDSAEPWASASLTSTVENNPSTGSYTPTVSEREGAKYTRPFATAAPSYFDAPLIDALMSSVVNVRLASSLATGAN